MSGSNLQTEYSAYILDSILSQELDPEGNPDQDLE